MFHKAVVIPTRRGHLDLWDFERLPNAKKVDHLNKYPTTRELISPFIDTSLRNGIGHNSAHYDAATDEVVWVSGSGRKAGE